MKKLPFLSLLLTAKIALASGFGGFAPSGDIHWKSPVANAAALPSSGNAVGDARTEMSFFNIYVWSGSNWISAGAGGTVTSIGVFTANGLAGTSDGNSYTPTLTLTTTVNGLVQGNGTAFSAATTTGTGSVVRATSPALVTPDLGTPSAVILTNATGTASGLTSGSVTTNANLTGPITSMGNATSIASQTGTGSTFVMDTSPTLITPNLGIPTSLVGTNITGTAAGLTAGTVTTNANLTGPIASVGNATSVTAQTGTGSVFVMDTSPTLVTPNLGTPSVAILTNATGTASGLTSGNVTTNANLTGPITSVGNATSVAAQTGTGSTFVMNTSPTLVTPALGTPTALVGTNITGTASGLTSGTVTTNANLTGPITSSGNVTSVASQTGTGSTFVMNTSPTLITPALGTPTALVGTNITGTASGLTSGSVTTSAATKNLWVSKQGSDSNNGSFLAPFLTVQKAVNQVATNADNSSFAYVINIGPGTYAENLAFNSAALYYVVLVGNNAVTIQPASGNSLTSTSNNTQLSSLITVGVGFEGNIVMTGDTNGSGLCEGACDFISGYLHGTHTFTNLNYLTFEGPLATIAGPVTFNNISFATIRGGNGDTGGGIVTLVNNNAGNQPQDFGGNFVLIEDAVVASSINVDAGSGLQYRLGSRVGCAGCTLTVNGDLESYNSFIRGTLTFNGGSTFENHNSSWNGTLNMSGTETDDGNIRGARMGLGNVTWTQAPAFSIDASTGALVSITANEIIGSGKTLRAMTIGNIVASASSFTCAVNPVFTLLDCGTSTGACTSGTTTLAAVTLTAANTTTIGTVSNASIAAGHYWAFELTAGTCTVLNGSTSAAYSMQ